MNYIYADHAATTATGPAAREAMLDCMENYYGNPSSLHTPGQKAAEKLWESREIMAKYLHARPEEIYFTSGGSEADNQALLTAAMIGKKKGNIYECRIT